MLLCCVAVILPNEVSELFRLQFECSACPRLTNFPWGVLDAWNSLKMKTVVKINNCT